MTKMLVKAESFDAERVHVSQDSSVFSRTALVDFCSSATSFGKKEGKGKT